MGVDNPTHFAHTALMDNLPLKLTKWNDRLAFDVALMLEGSGEKPDEVLIRHGIGALDLATYSKDPVFQKKVGSYREEVRDKGLTFKLKARAQAEELLTTSYLLIHDPGVSPAVKADLIKSTVKWAGLEPKGDVQQESGGGVRIMINLGTSPADTRTIEATVVDTPDATAIEN